MLDQYMPYLIFAIPFLLGAIMARRYNFLFGFVSIFMFGFIIVFLAEKAEDFVSSSTGIESGVALIQMSVYLPFMALLQDLVNTFGQQDLYNKLIQGQGWFLFGVLVGGFVVLHFVSTILRSMRVKEIKRLKRESRRY